MTRLRSLVIALLFATAAFVVTSVVHHAGNVRAAHMMTNHHVR